MHRLFLLSMILALAATGITVAQTPSTAVTNRAKAVGDAIGGVVIDEGGDPLIGAQVRVKGISAAAVTDIDGKFRIPGTNPDGHTVTVSYIGMETITLKAGSNMRIVMHSGSKEINEVVVNGFFTRNRQTYTGAAQTISGDQLLQVAPNNIMQSLATLDPSLNIGVNNAAGSNPNVVPDLVIRSTTSLNTDGNTALNHPLIVIDGVEQSSLQSLYDIDINDIERIDILKDASATALYGENAANGVIVIQRKRVSQSPVRIRYTITPQVSFADLGSYDVMNAAQKLEFERLAGVYATTDGSLDQEYYNKLALVSSGIDTDWKKKPVRNSFSQDHSLSVSGRGSGLDYNVTGNFSDTQGVMKEDGRQRYGMNLYMSYTAVDNLILTLRASHEQLNVKNSKYGSFSDYLLCNPYDSPYDDHGNLRSELTYNSSTMANPLYEASLSSFNKSDTRTQQISLDVRYNFKPNFYVTAQGAYNTSSGRTDVFTSPDSYSYRNVTNPEQKGSYTLGNSKNYQWSGKLVANYVHSFDKEGTMLTVNLGGELKKQNSTSSSLTATGFLDDNQNDIAYATSYPTNGKPYGSEDVATSVGIFAAGNFMWKNRYVVDGSYRRSGSSKFGSNSRYAPFWSVGVGYNIHNEDFVKKLGWVDMFRLRASYGYTGSVKFSSNQAVTTYQYDSQYAGYTGIGAVPIQMANPDLKWQTTKKFNVGLTSAFLNNRLNVNFDFYNEKTTDMVISQSLPPSAGWASVMANLGSQTSNGIEFSVWGKIIQTKDWEWSVSANGLHSKTTINDISDAMRRWNDSQATQTYNSLTINVGPRTQYREGESPSAIYAVRSAGIDPASGKEIFIKKDGSYTYTYDSADMVSCGDTNPELQGAFSTTLRWKQFSLNASFSYRFGGDAYNSTLVQKVERVNPQYNADVRAFEQRWKNPGDVVPFMDISSLRSNSSVYSDRFIQSDNELRMSSLYLQYQFKPEWLKSLHVQKLYVGIGTEDLFRITSAKYERGTSYPYSRSINMSASVTF